MTPSIRTSIAYVAGCLILHKTFSAVHDESLDTVSAMKGSFSNGNIDVNDSDNGASMIGMSLDSHATFSRLPENISVTLQLSGTDFKGSESSSNRNFNGSVTGTTVKLYDYDDGKYFYFGLVA